MPTLLRSSAQAIGKRKLRATGIVFKLVVSVAVLAYIYYRLAGANKELSLFEFFRTSMAFSWFGASIIVSSLVLMMINWGIEVVKWKRLLDGETNITWKNATKGVLSGVSFGIFSPNRLGEFAGRILALPPDVRLKGTLLSFVNGVAQTMATFSFGALGLVYLLATFGAGSIGALATLLTQLSLIICLGLALIVYFELGRLSPKLSKIGFLRKWKDDLGVFANVPISTLHYLYHLSLLRFVSFIGQYIVLFWLVLENPKWIEITGAATMMLFSSTLLPFLPVPDLLIKEAVAMEYFGLFQFDALKVSLVVFLVWFINVALPAVLGAAVLFSYRIFKRTR
ncbi:MAG: hypothetical protein WEC59_13825 [Salibacteraceae bacterium]